VGLGGGGSASRLAHLVGLMTSLDPSRRQISNAPPSMTFHMSLSSNCSGSSDLYPYTLNPMPGACHESGTKSGC
jgi:hypothetical protein